MATATAPAGRLKVLGLVTMIAGVILALSGVVTWFVVQNQLTAENITVAEDASFLAGDEVNGPFSAYAQAEIINKHALDASGGATYAELDREDPTRATVMNASFLRASLFTSVLAFGVSVLAVGLGVLFAIVGYAITSTGKALALAPAPARVGV